MKLKTYWVIVILITSCNRQQPDKNETHFFSKVYPPLNYKLTGVLRNGKKDGLWIQCDSLGRVETEQTYVDGKEFGVIKIYSSGNLVVKTSDTLVKNDTLTFYERYNGHGKVIEKGQYTNHLKKGIWVKYLTDGKTLRSKIDYQGKSTKVILKDTVYPEDF